MPLHHIELPREKRFLTVKETAKRLGVSSQTLRNWDKEGQLKAYRHPINNYRLYKAEDIELFIRRIESTGKIKLG